MGCIEEMDVFPAGTVENALLEAMLFIEVIGRNIEKLLPQQGSQSSIHVGADFDISNFMVF